MPLYFVSFRAILSPALVFFLLFCLCSRCRRITASPAPPRNYHPPRLVRPRVRHYCPECHSGLSATPPRPLRAQCGCSPCGACSGLFTCGAVSILSISRGCYPRFRPFPAILFGLCSFCRIVSGVSDYVPDAERELRLLVHFGRIFAAVFHFYLRISFFCCTFALANSRWGVCVT